MSKNLTEREKRCQDCACLISKNGIMCCDECFGQPCNEVDDCPEGATLEVIEEMEQKAKENKVSIGARASTETKESKPRTVKISDEKQALFAEIWSTLQYEFGKNAEILKENKLLQVKIGDKTFKIDIIEQRKPKK